MLGQVLTYLPAMILARLAGFAVLIGAAHLLAPASTGLLALVLLVGEVCEGIFLNWLRIFLLRQGSAQGLISLETARLCLRFWLAGILGASVLASLIGLAVAGGVAGAFIGAVLAYIAAISLFKCGLALLQMRGRARQHGLLEALRALVMAPAAIWAMASGQDWIFVAGVVVAITVTVGAVALWLGRTGLGGEDQRPALPEMIVMAPPLVALAALNFAIGSIDRLMLGFSASPAALAPYVTSSALGRQGFDIATNAVNAGGFPALVAARARGDWGGRLGEQARILIGVLLAGYVGLVLTRHDLVDLLLPEAYREEAAMLLPIIGLGAVALNLKNGLTDTLLLIEGRYWRQMIGLGAGAAVSVAMAMLLVPAWGGIGAAASFAAGALTVLCVSFWQAREWLKFLGSWAALVGVSGPAVIVALACGGVALLMPAAGAALRLGTTFALAVPLALWVLGAWPGRVAPHGG